MNYTENNKLAVIVAHDVSFGIGKDGKIPWHCREDMRHFKQVTRGKPCIMGRKTFDSLPQPLKNRPNVVVTSSWKPDCANHVCHVPSLNWGIRRTDAIYPNCGEIMICGGASIYEQVFEDWHVDKIYRTVLHDVREKCDAFFTLPFVDDFEIVEYEASQTTVFGNISFITYRKERHAIHSKTE